MLALSFLSRLAPARLAAEGEIAASLAWYPLAGLVLGLALALPFALPLVLLGQTFPFFPAAQAWLAGLAFTALHAWLTRALHWDGWADLFDAMGGGHTPETFQKILKDSRLGAFGGIALALGLAGMLLGSSSCLAAGAWPALLWAVLLGRCLVAPLAWQAKPMPGSSLGRLLLRPARSTRHAALAPITAPVFALLAGFACVGVPTALAALAAALAGVLFLRRLAARQGGLNGDYLGAAITWGELAGLLTAACWQSASPLL
ncbi:MAG: adenosylcobinamide-GDP ribazoletransferase [Deltaproteobacteria bacterium]|nr:adenosylcobinamide-GDP ribazoletransferase [Deltaproteobacteria bacterium]